MEQEAERIIQLALDWYDAVAAATTAMEQLSDERARNLLSEVLCFRVLRLHSALVHMPERYAAHMPKNFWIHFRAIRRVLAHDPAIPTMDILQAAKSFILPTRKAAERELAAWYYDLQKLQLEEWNILQNEAAKPLQDQLSSEMQQDLDWIAALAFGQTTEIDAKKQLQEKINTLQETAVVSELGRRPLSKKTVESMRAHAAQVHTCAPSLFVPFLNCVLRAEHPSYALCGLQESGYLLQILPELQVLYDEEPESHHTFLHVMQRLDRLPGDLKIRWASLYCDLPVEKPVKAMITRLTTLGYPPKFIEGVTQTMQRRINPADPITKTEIQKLLRVCTWQAENGPFHLPSRSI